MIGVRSVDVIACLERDAQGWTSGSVRAYAAGEPLDIGQLSDISAEGPHPDGVLHSLSEQTRAHGFHLTHSWRTDGGKPRRIL